MGYDKQLLATAGGLLVHNIIDKLKTLFSQVIVATSAPELYQGMGVAAVRDILPDCGPLSGLFSGLALCRGEYLYVAACDMPNLSEAYVGHILSLAKEKRPDAVVAYSQKAAEPFNALYSVGIAAKLRDFLLAGGRKTQTFLDSLNCLYIDEREAAAWGRDADLFANINFQRSGESREEVDLRPLAAKTPALRVTSGSSFPVDEIVAREEKISLYADGRLADELFCSGQHLEELAAGRLFTLGLINSRAELQSLEVTGGEARAVLAPGAPAASLAPEKRFSSRQILRLSPLFLRLSSVFEKTGGVHSCALSDGEEILFFAEDVGRHNAADKVIGHCLLRGIEMRDKLLLTSGRAPFEIIAKILRAGFALLVSRSAPTDKAIEAARQGGLPLVAFARNGRFNIYSNAEKIDLED